MKQQTAANQGTLKKVLRPRHMWAIIVGSVISGDYYGFNYGFASGGPLSFLLAFQPVTLFYASFVFCYIELAAAIPHSGGGAAYARLALGKYPGFITSVSILIAYVIAPCAISITSGDLIHFLIPAIPAVYATVAILALFIVINLFSVESSSRLEIIVTVLSLAGLVLYAVIAVPKFEMANFITEPALTHGWHGVTGAVTFAMWFYFAIDCGGMSTEEMVNPGRDIPKAYIAGLITLFLTALTVIILPAGIADYLEVAAVNFPLARSLELAYGVHTIWPKIFALVALSSMLAGYIGIIMAYSRQCFAMSRTGYLPRFLSRINRHGSPYLALLCPGVVALAISASGSTDVCIAIATFAALIMYTMILISLLRLRQTRPQLARPFRVASPLVPVISLIAVAFIIGCVLYWNLAVLKWVLLVYAVATAYYLLWGRRNVISFEEDFAGVQLRDDAVPPDPPRR